MASAVNTLLLQRHNILSQLHSKPYGSVLSYLEAIGRLQVEAKGEPREANWFHQNVAIAVQQSDAFSNLSADSEMF